MRAKIACPQASLDLHLQLLQDCLMQLRAAPAKAVCDGRLCRVCMPCATAAAERPLEKRPDQPSQCADLDHVAQLDTALPSSMQG